jgi:hypothetical protein
MMTTVATREKQERIMRALMDPIREKAVMLVLCRDWWEPGASSSSVLPQGIARYAPWRGY